MFNYFFKKKLILPVIILGVFFLNNYVLDKPLQNLVYNIVSKPGLVLTARFFNLSRYTVGFTGTKNIIAENIRIIEENNILRGRLAELDDLKRENEFLRDELKVVHRIDHPLLLVQIFNIQRGAPSSTALINKGMKDGVKKSMPVIATGNILVGIVDQVFNDSALVLLLDDPRVKISGRMQESGTLVETEGELQNQFKLNLIAVEDEVKEDDAIITSGLDGLPKTLLIGKIVKVELDNRSLFKNVSAKSLFDPALGSSLFVILQ